MRALVTGAGGFVGAHLVDHLLEARWDVTALLGRTSTPERRDCGSRCREIHGDMLSEGFLSSLVEAQGFDAVFHLAGLHAAVGAVDLYNANVVGTVMLLQALKRAQPDTSIVLMGSSAEYGASSDDPIREDSLLNPVGDYGISKMCMDLMGQAAFRQGQQRVCCARPFNIVGPGQRGALLQSTIIEQIVAVENGEQEPVVRTGNLDQRRDFIDVRDVAAGLVAISEKGIPGEAYNLCSGKAQPARSIVDHLLRMSGSTIRLEIDSRSHASAMVEFQRGSFEKIYAVAQWSPHWLFEQSLGDALAVRRKSRELADVSVSGP